MSDEQLDAMRESLGLNGNVAERYVSWAGKMLQGDWGLSVSNHQPVKKQIMDKLPNTIGLMGAALVLSILLSIPLGLLAGYYKNKWIDNIVSGISYLGISLPAFWFGIMMIILFSLNLGWLPSSGMHAIGNTSTGDLIKHAILPTLVLSVNNTAVFVRYIRANTIEQMEEDYVMTAVSKGGAAVPSHERTSIEELSAPDYYNGWNELWNTDYRFIRCRVCLWVAGTWNSLYECNQQP